MGAMLSALLDEARRMKAHVAAMLAKKGKTREAVFSEIGTSGLRRYGDWHAEHFGKVWYRGEPEELGLWLPTRVAARPARTHSFERLQFGDYVFDGHRIPRITDR